jgi:hypothetical protein
VLDTKFEHEPLLRCVVNRQVQHVTGAEIQGGLVSTWRR